MKPLFFLLSFSLCFSAMAASWESIGLIYPGPSAAQQKAANEAGQKQLAERQRAFRPRDPWRVIDGVTYYAIGTNWFQFTGRVLDIVPGQGVRIHGWYGKPCTYSPATDRETEFWVRNFPYRVADREQILDDSRLVARESGLYTYMTVTGGSVTLRALDFGAITSAPPPQVFRAPAAPPRRTAPKPAP